VNKQVYEDAIPCFYQVNRWYLGNVKTMTRIAKALPPERLKHLGHIYLRCETTHGKWFKKVYQARLFLRHEFCVAVQSFLSCTHLRKLEIEINEKEWLMCLDPDNYFQTFGNEKERKHCRVTQIPGISKIVGGRRTVVELTTGFSMGRNGRWTSRSVTATGASLWNT
jgi:hypothetical protein